MISTPKPRGSPSHPEVSNASPPRGGGGPGLWGGFGGEIRWTFNEVSGGGRLGCRGGGGGPVGVTLERTDGVRDAGSLKRRAFGVGESRRTSNGPTERRTQSPGATSMLSSYSSTPIWSSARSAWSWGGVAYRGHDGFRTWFRTSSRLPGLQRGDQGDTKPGRHDCRAAARSGRGVESDAPTEFMVWQVTEWRNGKAIRVRDYRSEAEALEAAGLSE